MKTLTNGYVYQQGKWEKRQVVIDNERIVCVDESTVVGEVIDCEGLYLTPSFMDPHVHFREPGFEYKETIKTGSLAAAKGGYTTVFMMPNLNPVPDHVDKIKAINTKISEDSCIEIAQISAITQGQIGEGSLVDFASIAPFTVGFSDDGRGIKNTKDMYEAMCEAKKVNLPIIAHCEDEGLINGGYIREGTYSKAMNHKGILGITETAQLARDLVLALETQVHYHVCHVSTKQSVDLIRFYKSLGCHVTAEVTPHHLLLSEADLQEDGNYKMNPPLGSMEDKEALLSGLLDGTIDCIATDHAPHAVAEKTTLKDAMFGIVGVETAFSLLYTYLVKTNKMPLPFLLDALSLQVAKVFHLTPNKIEEGSLANIAVLDLSNVSRIDSSTFRSKSRNQPFDGTWVEGKVVYTLYKGGVVYEEEKACASKR